jgi:hypothetical protein
MAASQQVMAVRCAAAHQLHFCLLSLLLSFHVKQALDMEEAFTFPIQTVANVFCMGYVVMIVIQQTQVLRMVSLRTFL